MEVRDQFSRDPFSSLSLLGEVAAAGKRGEEEGGEEELLAAEARSGRASKRRREEREDATAEVAALAARAPRPVAFPLWRLPRPVLICSFFSSGKLEDHKRRHPEARRC